MRFLISWISTFARRRIMPRNTRFIHLPSCSIKNCGNSFVWKMFIVLKQIQKILDAAKQTAYYAMISYRQKRIHVWGTSHQIIPRLLLPIAINSKCSNSHHLKHSIVSHLYDATAKARCYIQLKGGCNRIILPQCTHCTHSLCRLLSQARIEFLLARPCTPIARATSKRSSTYPEIYLPVWIHELIHEFRRVDIVVLAETINVAVNTEK